MRPHRLGEATARQRSHYAVAEMPAAGGEGRHERQQAEHAVAPAFRIDDRLPQRHVAAALAENPRAALRGGPHAVTERFRYGKLFAMQFGIAARQVDRIGIHCRRLVGKRRKQRDISARHAPAGQQMLVAKGIGHIAGHSDSLPQRRQARRTVAQIRRARRAGDLDQRFQMHPLRDGRRSAVDKLFQTRMFAGLHQAQMPLRQGKPGIGAQHGQNRHPDRDKRIAQHHLMPVAADPVEDDADNTDIVAKPCISTDQRRHRLRHAGAIDHQYDGEIQRRRQIGRRAGTIGGTVEQAHHRLDHQHPPRSMQAGIRE